MTRGGDDVSDTDQAATVGPLFVRTAAHTGAAAATASVDAARRLLPEPGAEAALDRVAALAARLVSAPAAQISLLTEVQTIAGGSGLPPGAIGSSGPVDESLCSVTVGQAAPLRVADAGSDARVNALPGVTSGAVGAYLGVPLRADSGDVVGALCVFDPQRHDWSDADTRTLQQLAEFVRAELERAALSRDLADNRTRWELAVEAGDVASFDWNLVTGELAWDDRLIAMYGYDVGDVAFDRSIASVEARVHPEDAALVDAAMSTAIAAIAPLHVLYRIVLPDGRVRWLEARGRALAGPDGTATRLLGVSWDVTLEHDNEARADRVLASMSVGYLAMDEDWRVTFVNDAGYQLLDVSAGQLRGKIIWDVFPDARGTVFETTYRRVAATRQAETLEAFYPAPLNAWYEVRVTPDPDGVALYFRDITERRRNLELLELSVDVSEQMVGAATLDDAVAVLARLVVPALADWSIVTIVDEDGGLRDVQGWHVDPGMRSVVESYAETRMFGGGSGAVTEVIRTGEPYEIPADVVGYGRRKLPSQRASELLVELAPESAVTLPLIAGDAVVGVLTLCRGAKRPVMPKPELALAASLCRRAGLAIDNARLYARQAAVAEHDRTVAEALQRAMLTRLPAAPGLQLEARYRTAADGDQVGGDWYDAITHPDGATTIVVGDVVGHDINAAAFMGQLRTMLRMLALQGGSPAAILRGLDRAMRDLRLRTLATAVVARIEPAAPGASERTMRWSNAGHPAPLLLHADGRTDVLAADAFEILLGVRAENTRTDHVRVLPADSTLVLYTDGLIERRDQDLEHGVEQLRAALGRHHDLGTDAMLDAVLAETVGDQPGDDVAVLTARLPAG